MAIQYPSFRFTEPFCSEGEKTVPPVQQNFTGSGRTSLRKGFPDECQKPIAQGGVPPFRSDMNGVLNALSQWVAWQGVGGLAKWDASITYQQGAVVFDGGMIRQARQQSTGVPTYNNAYWTAILDSEDRKDISEEIAEEVRKLKEEIKALRVGFIGEIILSSMTETLDRAMLCDGRSLSTTEYPELFAKIGYRWGGSGQTFRIPNLLDRVPQGAYREVGEYVEAGLPNIEGTFPSVGQLDESRLDPRPFLSGSFDVDRESGVVVGNQPEAQKDVVLSFNASKSSEIYGKSETVQPPAVKLAFYIRY